MKIASIKFLAAIFLFTLATAPLRAQTNSPAGNGTNPPVAVSDSAQASNPIAVTGASHEKNTSARVKRPALVEIHGSEKTGVEDVMVLMVVFGTFVAIVAMGLYFRYRRDKLTHETLLAMIEKGMPVTPELLTGLSGKRRPGSALFPGLLMTGIGTAMLITNYSGGDALELPGMGWAGTGGGWIVLFMGVAFLIVWLVGRKKINDNQPPKP